MEIALRTTEDEITRGAEEVEALCDEAGFAAARKDEVRTAVLEALSNALIHGSRSRRDRIVLRAAVEGSCLLVEVADAGPGPRRLPPAPNLERKLQGLEPPGGWGVHLMCLLASEVQFLIQPGGGHVVRLRFEARSPEPPPLPVIRRRRHA